MVALRVDMDALPVEERTGLPYASLNQGLMHACGHDIHTTVGLGVARILRPLAERLGGTVRLLFQPAEETAQGAAWMVADGAMQGVDALFGVHVFPSLPVGTIGVRSGSLTAAAGELEVEVLGEGGATLTQDLHLQLCLLYTSPSPRDRTRSRMPSSA